MTTLKKGVPKESVLHKTSDPFRFIVCQFSSTLYLIWRTDKENSNDSLEYRRGNVPCTWPDTCSMQEKIAALCPHWFVSWKISLSERVVLLTNTEYQVRKYDDTLNLCHELATHIYHAKALLRCSWFWRPPTNFSLQNASCSNVSLAHYFYYSFISDLNGAAKCNLTTTTTLSSSCFSIVNS